jgi:phosphoribosylformylglycinamidine synthase subunit PurS
MIKATIVVMLKSGVHDPQGNAVKGSLHSLGFKEVSEVRIGKRMEVWLDTSDRAEAEARVTAMCEKLLANPVIENYTFELEEGA